MSSESSPAAQVPAAERPLTSDLREELTQEETSAAGSAPTSLNPESVFTLLRNQRRRRVIAYLCEISEMVSLSDLAEHIAAIEHDTTPAALTWKERKRVYISLYQVHLPKLDDADAVVFNKPRGTIVLGPTVGQLRPYLEYDPSHSHMDRWPLYYFSVTGAIGVVFVATLLASGSERVRLVLISGLLASGLIFSLLQYHAR